jgi:glutamine cyclotransferase
MNIVTPMVYDNGIFVSQHRNGSFFYSVSDSNDVTTEWTSKGSGYMSTPIRIGDYAYLHLGNGRFSCVDLRTGEETWRTTPYGEYWSLLWQDDKILALDSEGTLRLIRANPERYEVLDEIDVADASTWGHLAMAGDQVFVRELEALTVFAWQSTDGAEVAPAAGAGDNSGPDSRRD